MKILTPILVLAMVVFISACSKNNVGKSALTGKWKLKGTIAGIGGPGLWTAVAQKADYDYVQFDESGRLEGTLYPDFTKYSIKDSVVTFTAKGKADQGYRYTITDSLLTMSPWPMMCTEGCASRFVKVN